MLIFYRLGLLLYHIIIIVSSPFNSKANLWLKGRKDLFKRIRETINTKKKLAWFHCASLGEFEQDRPLIEAYRENYPDHTILLTFFSPSGYETVSYTHLRRRRCSLTNCSSRSAA